MSSKLLRASTTRFANMRRCQSLYSIPQRNMNTGIGASFGGSEVVGGPYVSPYKDIFEKMHANGPTTFGTTQEFIDFHKEMEKNQKTLKCGIPESALRFTTTSYGRRIIAPFVKPNEHSVVLKVNTKYLPFQSSAQMEILREIVGNRLNDERRELRLTSNQFGSRIENKRHLVSMLDRIILSCQRLGEEIKDETQSEE